MERTSEAKPITIVAIGAGNRTNKYLEYAVRNPGRLKLVGVAERNDSRAGSSRSATSPPWGWTARRTDSSAGCGAARRSPIRC